MGRRLALLIATYEFQEDDNGQLYLAMANTRRDTLLFTALSAPSYLRNGLASPIAADRLAAMDGLDHLHCIGNASVRATVLTTLASLADDDSRQVSIAATTRLAALTTKPKPEPKPKPGARAARTCRGG